MKSKKYIAGLSLTNFAFLVPISLITWTWAMPLPFIDHEHVGLRNKTTGNVDSLWKCNECEPGMGLSVPCGGIVDIGTVIECVPCKEGETFSDKRDIGQCRPCRICPAFEKKTGKCLVDQDTTQCLCKAGFYRDQLTRACAPCSWCCNDTTNHFVSQCMGNPQGKHCSFQDFKSCSPSTTTATLTTATTEKSKGSKADLTTAAAGGIYKKSELNATDLLEKRTLETKSQDFDWGKKIVLPVGLVIAVIFIVGLSIYFCRRYSKRSNEPHDSASSSTSQSCEEVGDVIAQPLLNPKKLNQRLAEQKPNKADSLPLLPTDAIATFHTAGQGLAEILTKEAAERSQDSDAQGQPAATEEERGDTNDAPGQPGQPSTAIGEERRGNDTQGQPPSDLHRLASDSVDGINDSPWSTPDNPEEEWSGQVRNQETSRESKDGIRGSSELAAPRHSSMPRNSEDESEKRKIKELIHKTFGPKVIDMPYDVQHKAGLMLNYEQSSGNDYRAVADKVGLEYHEKKNLSRSKNPMEDVFDVMISQAKTVNDFVDILNEIKRGDVINKMYKMALLKPVHS